MHVVALLTCHNRREKTLAAIQMLKASPLPRDVRLSVVLVDDGSTDGTGDVVREAFPQVVIECGDGSLFWNRGMLRAWQRALQLSPDYVLWLNDDTRLYPQALSRLLETDRWSRSHAGRPGIVVGSTNDDDGRLSYGGSVPVPGINPLKMKKVVPGDMPKPAVTFNGNCVLVPKEVFERIGLLDEVFEHGMGDNDYGFRAHKASIPIWVMPGYAGRCANDNSSEGSFNDRTLPFRVRWKKIMSAKGLPVRSWLAFCRRYAGPFWPIYWLWPYAKLMATSIRGSG
jgi:GT2 family glycosyltransferase